MASVIQEAAELQVAIMEARAVAHTRTQAAEAEAIAVAAFRQILASNLTTTSRHGETNPDQVLARRQAQHLPVPLTEELQPGETTIPAARSEAQHRAIRRQRDRQAKARHQEAAEEILTARQVHVHREAGTNTQFQPNHSFR
jgi:hypothetical protein